MAGLGFLLRIMQQDKLLHEGTTVLVASQGLGSVVETDCYYCIFKLIGLRLIGFSCPTPEVIPFVALTGGRAQGRLAGLTAAELFPTSNVTAQRGGGTGQVPGECRRPPVKSGSQRTQEVCKRTCLFSKKKGFPQRTGATVNLWQPPRGILLLLCTSFPIQAELSQVAGWACESLTPRHLLYYIRGSEKRGESD